MVRQSFRKRFVFWLDIQREDENYLAETIENLKERRSFAKTIRDGIRLIVDLRQGNTDVLAELFPWLQDRLNGEVKTQSLPLQEHLGAAFEPHMKRLEALLTSNPRTLSVSGDGTALPLPKKVASLSNQIDDDLGITVTAVRAENSNASQNFLESMFNL